MLELFNTRNGTLDAFSEEAYRSLRTNIKFCGCDKDIKTIVVTSCNPGEGKTTTSVNLSIFMARSGERTLLVDGDMRKPMRIKELGNSYTRGLSSFLSGQAKIEDIIIKTSVENLYFAGCGIRPPNPYELLNSKKFTEFVEEVRSRFDMVIFDTPPLGSLIDSAIMSSKVDGTVLVIMPKKASISNVQQVKKQLEKANAHILGVVLNKVQRNTFSYYYNYYISK